MKKDFTEQPWDERDPNPWLALYLDQSTPLPDAVKALVRKQWGEIKDTSGKAVAYK